MLPWGHFCCLVDLVHFFGEKKIKEYTHGGFHGISTVYSPDLHFCHFLYGFHVGEYTIVSWIRHGIRTYLANLNDPVIAGFSLI